MCWDQRRFTYTLTDGYDISTSATLSESLDVDCIPRRR